MVILHAVENSDVPYGIKELDQYEWAVYQYTEGCYEGDGNCLAYKKGKWYHYSLSHCSCFGPLDGGPEEVYKDYRDLYKVGGGLLVELMPLIDIIKENELEIKEKKIDQPLEWKDIPANWHILMKDFLISLSDSLDDKLKEIKGEKKK